MLEEKTVGFEVSISGRDDGTIEAMYVQISDLPIAKTVEIKKDALLADYDVDGQIVGIEIISPVKLSEVESLIASHGVNDPFRRFLERSAPRDFVTA